MHHVCTKYCWLYFVLFMCIIVRTRSLLLSYAMDIHVYDMQRRAMVIISMEVHRQTQRRRGETGDLIRFHSVFPLGKVDVLLVLPCRFQLLLMLKSDKVIRGCYR